MRMVEHWKRLLRAGESLSLEKIKTSLNVIRGSLLQLTVLSRELYYMISRGPSQPQIPWSKDFEVMFIFRMSLKHRVHLYLSL